MEPANTATFAIGFVSFSILYRIELGGTRTLARQAAFQGMFQYPLSDRVRWNAHDDPAQLVDRFVSVSSIGSS